METEELLRGEINANIKKINENYQEFKTFVAADSQGRWNNKIDFEIYFNSYRVLSETIRLLEVYNKNFHDGTFRLAEYGYRKLRDGLHDDLVDILATATGLKL